MHPTRQARIVNPEIRAGELESGKFRPLAQAAALPLEPFGSLPLRRRDRVRESAPPDRRWTR